MTAPKSALIQALPIWKGLNDAEDQDNLRRDDLRWDDSCRDGLRRGTFEEQDSAPQKNCCFKLEIK